MRRSRSETFASPRYVKVALNVSCTTHIAHFAPASCVPAAGTACLVAAEPSSHADHGHDRDGHTVPGRPCRAKVWGQRIAAPAALSGCRGAPARRPSPCAYAARARVCGLVACASCTVRAAVRPPSRHAASRARAGNGAGHRPKSPPISGSPRPDRAPGCVCTTALTPPEAPARAARRPIGASNDDVSPRGGGV